MKVEPSCLSEKKDHLYNVCKSSRHFLMSIRLFSAFIEIEFFISSIILSLSPRSFAPFSSFASAPMKISDPETLRAVKILRPEELENDLRRRLYLWPDKTMFFQS